MKKLPRKKFFEVFYSEFAQPLKMEDFEISDGYYHYERHKSSHPAYPFRMSARDLARFGLLFLKNGKWENKQILSKDWVQKSTNPISQTYAEGEGYGFLWWVDHKNFKYNYYSAEGTGGHGIIIVPELDLVIVHRTNTYTDKRISYRQRGKLISKIMEAYTGPTPANQLQLKPYISKKAPLSMSTYSAQLNKKLYEGTYSIEKLNEYESDFVKIYTNNKNELEIFIPYKGYFELIPIDKTLFLLEDSNEFISFLFDENNQPKNIIYHRNSRIGKKNNK